MDSTPLDAVMMEHGPPAGGTVMMDPPVIQTNRRCNR